MPGEEQEPPEPNSAEVRRTLIEPSSPENTESSSDPAAFMPPPPPVSSKRLSRVVKKLDSICLKTRLDPEACRKIAEGSSDKKVAQLKEIIESATAEPFVPLKLIDKYRKTTPCSARWEDMNGKGLFKVCHKCRLHVYDFSKTDQSDAEKLVLTREGKENPIFYRRNDGKFLTSDCPVAVAQRRQLIIASAAGALLVIALVTMAALAPPPPPPTVTVTPAQSRSKGTSKINSAGAASESTVSSGTKPSSSNGVGPQSVTPFEQMLMMGGGSGQQAPQEQPVWPTHGQYPPQGGIVQPSTVPNAAGILQPDSMPAGSQSNATTPGPIAPVDSPAPTAGQSAQTQPAAATPQAQQSSPAATDSNSNSQPANNPYVQYYK